MNVNVSKIEQAFLQAMAHGWVNPRTQITEVPDMPGFKEIRHYFGDYLVVDRYVSDSRSGMSLGSTAIWLSPNKPVWMMSYGGQYQEREIPFLKDCLRKNYLDEPKFCGGRGPRCIRGKSYTYLNNFGGSGFSSGNGKEKILSLEGTELGHHWYHYSLL